MSTLQRPAEAEESPPTIGFEPEFVVAGGGTAEEHEETAVAEDGPEEINAASATAPDSSDIAALAAPPTFRVRTRLRWIIESPYYDGEDLAEELSASGFAPIALGPIHVRKKRFPNDAAADAFVEACIPEVGGCLVRRASGEAGEIEIVFCFLPVDRKNRPVDTSKRPAGTDWRHAPFTLDWWRRGAVVPTIGRDGQPVERRGSRDRNVGLRTGDGLVVVDIDRKDGKDGLVALIDRFGGTLYEMFPPTFVVRTPSGGLHLYYRTTARIPCSASKVVVGVDVRGEGGMIVAPGSLRVNGRRYWPLNYDPIAELPDTTVALLLSLKAVRAVAADGDVDGMDPNAIPVGDRMVRAVRYLEKVPPAIQGRGGRTHTFSVAVKVVKGFGLPVEEALTALADWNARSEPPWEEADLRERVESAAREGTMRVGALLRKAKSRGGVAGNMHGAIPAASPPSGSGGPVGPPPPVTVAGPTSLPPLLQRGDHAELAEVHLARMPGRTVYAEGKTYVYRDGIWRGIDDLKQIAAIQGFAGTMVQNGAKPYVLRVNADTCKGALYLANSRSYRRGFFSEAPQGLVFGNGFLRERGGSLVLEPHSEDHRARFSYDFDYERDAPCDEWREYLLGVFQGDDDAVEKTAALQEFVGASLFGAAARFKTALILFGDTDSGKSTCIDVVRGVFPAGTVTSVGLHDFEQEYRRAKLAGKLLNTIAEVPNSDLVKSESFKAIIGGDVIEGRPIRGAPFDFRPLAGHLFAANTLPKITDRSEATWSRWLLLTFNRRFSRTGADGPRAKTGLADAILRSERPGIIAWAAEGYARLLAAGRYTVPRSSDRGLDAWKRDSDPVELFFEDELELSPRARLQTADAYRRYRSWCEENGFRMPFAHPTFTRALATLLRKVTGNENVTVLLHGYTVFVGVSAKQHDPGHQKVDWSHMLS